MLEKYANDQSIERSAQQDTLLVSVRETVWWPVLYILCAESGERKQISGSESGRSAGLVTGMT